MNPGSLLLFVLVTVVLSLLPTITERWGIFGEDWDALKERHRKRVRGEEHLVGSDSSLVPTSVIAGLTRFQKHLLFFSQYLLLIAWLGFFALEAITNREQVDPGLLLRLRPATYVLVVIVACAIAAFASYWKVKTIEEDLEYLDRQKRWRTTGQRGTTT